MYFHDKRLVDMGVFRKDFGELVKPSYDTSLLTRRGRKVARRSEACTLRHLTGDSYNGSLWDTDNVLTIVRLYHRLPKMHQSPSGLWRLPSKQDYRGSESRLVLHLKDTDSNYAIGKPSVVGSTPTGRTTHWDFARSSTGRALVMQNVSWFSMRSNHINQWTEQKCSVHSSISCQHLRLLL